jgi:hypothetical protein
MFTPRVEQRIDFLYKDRLATLLAVNGHSRPDHPGAQRGRKLANAFALFTCDNGFLIGPGCFPSLRSGGSRVLPAFVHVLTLDPQCENEVEESPARGPLHAILHNVL